jgi:hypothetical protein
MNRAQVAFRQPVVQRGRQQQGLIQVVGSEALAHSQCYGETPLTSKHFMGELFEL